MYGIIAISIVAVLVVIAVRLFMQNSQQQSPQPQSSNSTQPLPRFSRAWQRWLSHWRQQRGRYVGAVAGLVFVGLIAFTGVWAMSVLSSSSPEEETNTETNESATPASESATDDCQTWQLAESDNGQHRWFASGVPAMTEVSNDTEARQAAHEWLRKVRQDPQLLSGAASYLLVDRQVDEDGLFDGEGCATPQAVELASEMEAVLALSSVSPEEAPQEGVNSGVGSDGQVTHASSAGITGDRTAVKIVPPKGETLWVMARCGNPVTERPPEDIPEGPTDQPTVQPPTEQPPREQPPTEQPPTEQPPTEVKDPTKGPLQNPEIPPQVRGPGTTPPGGDRGPPDDPADHDRSDPDIAADGCPGSCPEAEPEQPEADPERTPPTTQEPPEPDEPAEGNNPDGNDPSSCGDGDDSCGYEQPASNDGSPQEDDSSSGGAEDGVVESPDSDDSSSSSGSSTDGQDNPQHDPNDPEDQPSEGSQEDTSDVDEDTNASQSEDETNDNSGSNPF